MLVVLGQRKLTYSSSSSKLLTASAYVVVLFFFFALDGGEGSLNGKAIYRWDRLFKKVVLSVRKYV